MKDESIKLVDLDSDNDDNIKLGHEIPKVSKINIGKEKEDPIKITKSETQNSNTDKKDK
jgi:hypothetical protein